MYYDTEYMKNSELNARYLNKRIEKILNEIFNKIL
jgi:hypothetical protein